MLDFDSDIILWIGSKVESKFKRMMFRLANAALAVIYPKSHHRDGVSMSITFEGYEPEVFTSAFK